MIAVFVHVVCGIVLLVSMHAKHPKQQKQDQNTIQQTQEVRK